MTDHLEPALCAFVDVLGFRRTINEAYASQKQEELFHSLASTFADSGGRMRQAGQNLPMLKVKFFSDNLVVAYSVVPFFMASLMHLCELLGDYQLKMACNYGLFLRGAISLGTLGINEDFIFGDCLLRAHDLEKGSAKFPRIIIDPEMRDRLAAVSAKSDPISHSSLTHLLFLDSDGNLFVNYLTALYNKPRPGHPMTFIVNEDQLLSHRTHVENRLAQNHKCPDVWLKYFWVANYHNHFCDTQNQHRHRIPENLLLPKPVQFTAV